MFKTLITLLIIIILFLLGPLYLLLSGQVHLNQNWQTANRSQTGLLKPYHLDKQAAVVLFSAKAFNWRGMFSTHTWLAVKTAEAKRYTIYQVFGWNAYRGLPPVDISHGQPDRYWFGYRPQIDGLIKGEKAQALIPAIEKAVKSYPYANRYVAWPGPNSNTFIQYVLNQVPQLNMQTPFNALGRDYQPRFSFSHISLWGLLGYQVQRHSFVINFLGLTVGVNSKPWAVIIPGVGQTGS